MSSFMFVFLTGRDKGRTRIYHQDRVTIGTSESCDLVLSVNGARATGKLFGPQGVVAQVKNSDGGPQLVIKCGDELPVAINGERVTCEPPATSVALYDGDSIRFGEPGTGPELLFHVLRDDFRSLQPVPKNPDVSLAPDGPASVHPLTATLFVKELATSLWAEVPRRVKAYSVFGAFAVALFAVLFIFLVFQQLRASHEQIGQLQREIERDREEREAGRKSIEEQQRRLDDLQKIYEGNRSFAQRISEQFAEGVCLIVGTYTFADRVTGKPLRYETADFANGSVVDETGDLVASVDGLGPAVEVEFTGTGFLVAEDAILTNRHVVQPWWRDDRASLIIAQGMRPRIEKLYAYFPKLKTPFTLRVARVSESQDLAVVRVDLGDVAVRVLPVSTDAAPTVTPGKAVVLLGFPAGVEALVERLPEADRAAAIGRGNRSIVEVAELLAERGAIRPLTTQGIVGDVVPGRIVHNAATAEGGSGGPLFDDSGQVIGVNSAILVSAESGMSFQGSNFGIPVSAALPLLKATQAKPEE
jgi:S1-C subfamily serine protease